MKLRQLPGYPALYLDFIENSGAARKFFPCRPARENLQVHAREAAGRTLPRDAVCRALQRQAAEHGAGPLSLENVRRLGQPATVAVLTNARPGLFGGPLITFLKCMTAVRLAGILEAEGLEVVPVCWVGAELNDYPEARQARILDSEGRIRELSVSMTPSDPPGAAILPEDVESQVARLEDFLSPEQRNSYSATILRGAYTPGTPLSLATRRLLAGVLEEWGVVVVDAMDPDLASIVPVPHPGAELLNERFAEFSGKHEHLLTAAGYDSGLKDNRWTKDPVLTNSVLPAAANVIDPESLAALSLLVPYFSEQQLRPPVLWPSVTATIVDARSRKVLDKYALGVEQLFAGPDQLLRELENREGHARHENRFDDLLTDVQSQMDELKGLVPPGDQLAAVVDDTRAKILYQLNKVKERYTTARDLRLEAAGRQIDRLCNSLAPEKNLQERHLAGIHFILRHSRTVLRNIVQKGDVTSLEHQLIFVD